MNSMKKKLGIVLGSVIAGLVLLIVVLLLTVDVNAYRGTIEAQLERQLGREVTLGELSLSLIPLGIQVGETRIAEAPGFGEQDFVTTERLAVRASLLSLLFGNIEIHSLELDRPDVELVRNAAGTWNFSTLGSAGPESGTPAEGEAPAGSRSVVLDRLTIRDGRVAVSDLGKNTHAVYDHIDLTLRDFSPGEPFSFDVAAHLPGGGAGELGLAGSGGPIDAANPLDTPFAGTLTLDAVDVEALKAFLETDILASAGGSLSGETEVASQSGVASATGSLALEDARFNGIEVSYPIQVDYDLDAALAEGIYTIDRSTVHLGPTPVSVAGDLNTGADPMRVDLNIVADDISISEVARLASAFGVAFPADSEVDGRVSMDVGVSGPTDRLALTGNVAGRDIRVSGAGAPQPIEVAALDLDLSPSQIRSNEFEIRTGDTTATANFALDGYATDNPRIDARLRAPDATLPEIQSIARAYGMTGLDQLDGAGVMNLDLRAQGPLDSVDSRSLVRALDGNIDLDFSPLSIAGFNTARELGEIGEFDSGANGGAFTDLIRLTGQVVVDNGIARTDDLLAALAIGNLSATGTANLVEETLDLRVSAVLSQEFSQSVGGTGIGGYLNTALSNSAGEIVLPLRVTGSFQNPRFAPDLDALARMQRERLVPTFDDPGAAVSSVLGALSGPSQTSEDEEGQNQDEDEPDATETIRGILGGLLGGGSDEPK